MALNLNSIPTHQIQTEFNLPLSKLKPVIVKEPLKKAIVEMTAKVAKNIVKLA